ncbi:MAG: hypothetical protein RL219_2118 [Actinomycetota bacterium]|jgi:glycosyltransferase involved in cell wall biosynthesis
MSERGTISVVIPVFNGERFIAEAIRSAQQQTRAVLEIIVVDDGSTDATAAAVSDFPDVVLVQQPNAGPSAARNRGISMARGEYIAPLDADDIWPLDRLEIMGSLLDSEPQVAAVVGIQQLLVEPGVPIPSWVPNGDVDAARGEDLARPTGSMLTRRSAFDAIGLFDEELRHGEDTDWYLRAQDAGLEIRALQDIVLVRRIHGGNLTMDAEAQRRARFVILQRRMARKRAQ